MRVCMREYARLSWANLPISSAISKLHQGVAPPGRTYLTYRWRVKQGERKNGAHAENVAMHLCVCLPTLI